jgi:hypothetical protein
LEQATISSSNLVTVSSIIMMNGIYNWVPAVCVWKWEYEITFFGRNTFQDVGNKEGRISATCKIKETNVF